MEFGGDYWDGLQWVPFGTALPAKAGGAPDTQFAIGITGACDVDAGDFPDSVFGLFDLAPLVPTDAPAPFPASRVADAPVLAFSAICDDEVVADTVAYQFPSAPGDPVPVAVFYWRHAADLGNAAFKFQVAQPPSPISPTVDPVWTKGDQIFSSATAGMTLKLRATRPDKSWVFAQSPWIDMEASMRYEWILLGNKLSNAKFVIWVRKIVEKAP